MAQPRTSLTSSSSCGRARRPTRRRTSSTSSCSCGRRPRRPRHHNASWASADQQQQGGRWLVQPPAGELGHESRGRSAAPQGVWGGNERRHLVAPISLLITLGRPRHGCARRTASSAARVLHGDRAAIPAEGWGAHGRRIRQGEGGRLAATCRSASDAWLSSRPRRSKRRTLTRAIETADS